MKMNGVFRPVMLLVVIGILLSVYIFQSLELSISDSNVDRSTFDPETELKKTPYGTELLNIFDLSLLNPENAQKKLATFDNQFVIKDRTLYRAYRMLIQANIAQKANDIKEVEQYTDALFRLSEKENIEWLRARLLIDSAIQNAKEGSTETASELINEAILIAENIQYESLLIKAYNTAGAIFNVKSDLLKAQKYFHKGLYLADKYPGNIYNSKIVTNMALLYIYLEEWDKALKFIRMAEDLYGDSDDIENGVMQLLYTNESFLHVSQGNAVEARESFEKASQYFNHDSNSRLDVISLKAEADLLLIEGRYQEALDVAQSCLQREHIQKYKLQHGQCYLLKARANIALNNNERVEKDLYLSLALFKEVGSRNWIIPVYKELADFYEINNKVNQAFMYLKLYYQGHKGMLFDKRKSELYYLEQSFNVQQIENNLQLLKVEKNLNNALIEKQKLRHWMIFSLLAITCLGLISVLRRNKKLVEETTRCSLTGLFNRRYLDYFIKNTDSPALTPYGYSIAILDLDHFKSINDTFGHDIGDDVLVEVAKRLVNTITNNDLMVRWGGEEFVCVLQGEQPADLQFEAIRTAICGEEFSSKVGSISMSISIGAVTRLNVFELSEEYQHHLKSADEALYRAKQSGRNRVEFA